MEKFSKFVIKLRHALTVHPRTSCLLMLLAAGIILWIHSIGPHAKHSVIAVDVTPALLTTLEPVIEASGSVAADNTANIMPQITGLIANILVNPGDHVKKDQLLFQIEPATFKAQITIAQANLARDVAILTNTQQEFNRYKKLVKQGYVSKELFDQMSSNVQSALATVAADRAALTNALIQLDYTQIRAPISGKLSDINQNVGDLVGPGNTTPLTTINQFQPIDVQFSLPAQYLTRINNAQKTQVRTVIAIPDTDPTYRGQGTLFFINNQIDPTTGALTMKASFPNQDERLWPGMFVKVLIIMPKFEHALVIPNLALEQDQNQRYYVYVVDRHNQVHRQFVIPGPTQGDKVAISSGLKQGDSVVVHGQFQIADGALVNPTKIR